MNIFRKVVHNVRRTLFHPYTRTDLTPFEFAADPQGAVHGVYHIFCDEGWDHLVAQQLERLKRSGLAERTTCLHVCCITQREADVDRLTQLMSGLRWELAWVGTDPASFEYPAMDEVWRLAQADAHSLIYYFHTKGVSFHAYGVGGWRYRYLKQNTEAWRKVMEYFLMDRWQVAVNVLQSGWDAYGCLRYPPGPEEYTIYAGNFWWVTAAHVRRLTPTPPEKRADRMLPELWIYSAKGRHFSAFDTMALLYRVPLPASLYLEAHPPLKDRLRFTLIYNVLKVLIRVFGFNFGKHFHRHFQMKYQPGKPCAATPEESQRSK